MEFTAQVTLVTPDNKKQDTVQTNTEKAKALIFEALQLLAEDDPNILIDASASIGHLKADKEIS